ncbi:hypothetical protein ACFQZS_12035 [Mucilaginibacter calamicampi]|uniref:Glycosyl-4,4'-diaponeurosporenoate acyltransferase n=1 Tax=Mucilaginibacter calamicampi TaxID=1302352 RepID=A0ABW2Z2F1_9SPHI
MKYLKFMLAALLVVPIIVYIGITKHPYSFLFAWVLNFGLMMAVFIFTNTFTPKLTSDYYNSKKWEANGAIYKWLGVDIFRKFLVLIGWEKVIRAGSPIKKNPDAIKHLENGTRQSEFGHLVIFFIVLIVNVFVALSFGITKSLSLFFTNIIFNFYPVILQRSNRPRLQRMLRINARKQL